MATTKHTAPAQLRREVEARTGCCANMRQLGFIPTKYTLAGEPTRFADQLADTYFVIRRTPQKTWRIARVEPRGRWTHERKVIAPTFAGPVAAAIWLKLEIENETIRFDQG